MGAACRCVAALLLVPGGTTRPLGAVGAGQVIYFPLVVKRACAFRRIPGGPDLERVYEFVLGLYYEPKQLFRIDPVEHKIYPCGAIHAVKMFQQTDPLMVGEVTEGLANYGLGLGNGEYEAYFGEVVPYPFKDREEVRLDEFVDGEGNTWQVVIDEAQEDQPLPDEERWASHCFFRSLSRYNEGDVAEAHRLFDKGMAYWDGTGFYDDYTQYTGYYASYVIGLAMYTSRAVGVEIDGDTLVNMDGRLRGVQRSNGGIATLYASDGEPAGTAADGPSILTIIGYIGEHPR